MAVIDHYFTGTGIEGKGRGIEIIIHDDALPKTPEENRRRAEELNRTIRQQYYNRARRQIEAQMKAENET